MTDSTSNPGGSGPTGPEGKSQLRIDLERAAELVLEKGHIKGQLKGGDGSICMLQSLREASGVEALEGDVNATTDAIADAQARYRAAERAVELKIGTSICGWNNEQGRTKEGVAAKLKEVAQAA
jgi:hypothetical protein